MAHDASMCRAALQLYEERATQLLAQRGTEGYLVSEGV